MNRLEIMQTVHQEITTNTITYTTDPLSLANMEAASALLDASRLVYTTNITNSNARKLAVSEYVQLLKTQTGQTGRTS